ncbi:MAG: hypothetical protein P4L77_14085 [Sulfuriferula sp.]|nr:hypothetical protein [Sulfuriferula sp.]
MKNLADRSIRGLAMFAPIICIPGVRLTQTTGNKIAVGKEGGANQPPTVSIVRPLDNSSYAALATINLSANAADSLPFWVGGTSL